MTAGEMMVDTETVVAVDGAEEAAEEAGTAAEEASEADGEAAVAGEEVEDTEAEADRGGEKGKEANPFSSLTAPFPPSLFSHSITHLVSYPITPAKKRKEGKEKD